MQRLFFLFLWIELWRRINEVAAFPRISGSSSFTSSISISKVSNVVVLYNTNANDIVDAQRRRLLEWTTLSLSSSPLAIVGETTRDTATAKPAAAAVVVKKEEKEEGSLTHTEQEASITIPLRFISSLNAYVLYFYLFGDDTTSEKFGAILDTGSPFLTVPSYCNRAKWGCYRPELSKSSGYANTVERFDNNQGLVVWRQSRFSFADAVAGSSTTAAALVLPAQQEVVFGVLDENLMDGPGGVFFGLIKKTEKRIRPSFLGQLKTQAFKIDLKSEKKTLTLSNNALINNDGNNDDYIPLVTDLNRRYKDPVLHYTAMCDSIVVNGSLLQPEKNKNIKRPTYVIFDTGVTGMVVSQQLFDERYTAAIRKKEKSLWGSVALTFKTKAGNVISLEATKPVTTPLGETPWPGFNANLIVVGLAFLDGRTMTVDIDDLKIQFDDRDTVTS